jgi:hypothetical protein
MPVLNLDETSQPLFTPGSSTGSVTLINLSDSDTIYVSTTPVVHISDIPVGPLASMTFDGSQWWYGSAITEPLVQVAVLPGTTGYGAGSLNISGPVTAEITGPVTVEGTVGIDGTVDASVTGTVDISGTPTVDLASGATVEISGTPTVELTGTADVNVENAQIDVFGAGGYILPGQTASLYHNAAAVSLPTGGGNTALLSGVSVAAYNSLDFSIDGAYITGAAGAADASVGTIIVEFSDLDNYIVETYTINVPVAWGGSANGSMATFSVPCAGSLVNVFVYNFGITGGGTLVYPVGTIGISGSYRSISGIKYNATIFNHPTVNSIIWAESPNTAQNSYMPWVAQIDNPTLTTGDSYGFNLNGYSGTVQGFFRPNGGTPSVIIADLGVAATIGGITTGVDSLETIYVCEAAAAGDVVPVSFNLPPSPCAALIAGTTGQSFNLQLLGTV